MASLEQQCQSVTQALAHSTHLKDHSILDHIQVESRWGYTGPVQQAVSLTVFIHYTLTSWAL